MVVNYFIFFVSPLHNKIAHGTDVIWGIDVVNYIAVQEGLIDEELYLSKIEKLAYLAYEDQCSPANPRVHMVNDIKEILKEAYYTEEFIDEE